MFISTDGRKLFDRVHDMIETTSKLGIEESLLNVIKSIYEKTHN